MFFKKNKRKGKKDTCGYFLKKKKGYAGFPTRIVMYCAPPTKIFPIDSSLYPKPLLLDVSDTAINLCIK
jgi:hypothetical protein